jgi:hypothetical protein
MASGWVARGSGPDSTSEWRVIHPLTPPACATCKVGRVEGLKHATTKDRTALRRDRRSTLSRDPCGNLST